MDPLGIIGIMFSLAIAYWQHRRAITAELKFDKYLQQLPAQLVEGVVKSIESAKPAHPATDGELLSSDRLTSVMYADLNNDGQDELIVQFPVGVHGSAIQIYEIGREGLKLITEWSSDTPAGFEIDNSDPQFAPLLRTGETNRSSELPYVSGLRDVVWYRLEHGQFVEHKRIEPDANEISLAKRSFNEEHI